MAEQSDDGRWSRGCGSRRGRGGTTGRLWCSDQHDRRVLADQHRRRGRDDRRGAGVPVRARLAPGRTAARRLDARPPAAAARPGRAHRGRRPLARSRPGTATTWSSTRSAARTSGTSASTSTAAPTPATDRDRPRRPRRLRSRVAADEIRFPNGTVITPDGADVDRGGELRRVPHRVRRRRRRHALEPPAVGAARRARCRTGSASTPKVRSGPRAR